MTRPKKSDWLGWLKNRFGFSSKETPVQERPPKEQRGRKKQPLFAPYDEKLWDECFYKDRNFTSKDWGKFTNTLCKKGAIGSASPREKGIWQIEKTSDGVEHFYVSCVECGAVNDFTNHSVREDGEVSPCVVCRKCKVHFWITLEGWTGEFRKEVKSAEDMAWEKKWEDWKKEWDKNKKDKGTIYPNDMYGGFW